jgi:hypothetical protein
MYMEDVTENNINVNHFSKFQVLTMVSMKMSVFWDVAQNLRG